MDNKIINPMPTEDIDNIMSHYNSNFENLELIGEGTDSEIFKYKKYAIKFQSNLNDGKILKKLQDNDLFIKLYFYNEEFMVTELLDNFNNGYEYYERNVETPCAEYIFDYCINRGYIPYDLHDENVIVTKDDKLKIIDVGAFIDIHDLSKSLFDKFIKAAQYDLDELKKIIEHVKKPKIAI